MSRHMSHKHHWVVIKTIWPYRHGHGTFCHGCRTLCYDGLPKEVAKEKAEELNNVQNKNNQRTT
jgi:hypothetical protein